MLGPYGVNKLHPSSLIEAESMTFYWKDGLLSVTYVFHEMTESDGPFYLAEWQVQCPEPKKVREQKHRSANLLGEIDGLTT